MTTVVRPANRDVLKPRARFLGAMGWAALTLGAVLTVAGILIGAAPKGDLRIEPATLAVGDLFPGARKVVNLRIRNDSGRTLRVVGMERVCSGWGCCDSAALPSATGPSAWGVVPIELKAKSTGFTGEFAQDVLIYTDSRVDGRVVVRLAGRVVPIDAHR
jgi:hypothetical protein